METLIVGVDVSKESFSVTGLDSSGVSSFIEVFPMDADGFSKFLGTMTAQQPDISAIVGAWNPRHATTSIFSPI